MTILSDAEIRKLLKEVRIFAVVGASPKMDRPSYGVMAYLLEKGYQVHPINPTVNCCDILGQKVYRTLTEVPAPVDVVDFFRSSDVVLEDVRVALKEKDRLHVKCIWMQPGVLNETAASEAINAGLTVVIDRCPKKELARLL